MKNNEETPSATKELLTELQALAVEAQALVSDSSSDVADECLQNLRDRFSAVQERFNQAYDGAKNKVVAGARSTDGAIRENPYTALAVALGVGLGLGVLLGRRTK